MNALKYIVAIAGITAATAAFAQSGADVVKDKGCLNCHAVDTKKVGPSFKDIAAKPKPADTLVMELRDGKGHPKVAATEAEIKAAVTYVLSQK